MMFYLTNQEEKKQGHNKLKSVLSKVYCSKT